MALLDGSALSAGTALVTPQHAHTDHFKEALARLASGVAIVTCGDEDRPHGLLVSSITGLSLDPLSSYSACARKPRVTTPSCGASFAA